MKQRKASSWGDFKQQLAELRQEHAASTTADWPLLFRGQENAAWELKTTLEREYGVFSFASYYHVISKIRPQVESLTDRDWPITAYPEIEKLCKTYEFFDQFWAGPRPGYAYMAYLRHHGFPSPLLDWTRSAQVAAFFAFSKVPNGNSGNVAIFATAPPAVKLHGNGMPLVFRYGHYVKTHRRHVLQQSDYTLCMGFNDEWKFEPYESVFDGLHQQAICWKFQIPATERRNVLMELDAHNLNAFSLFGSEESLMETLAIREFCLEKDPEEKSEATSA